MNYCFVLLHVQGSVGASKIFFGVKTCSKYHSTRCEYLFCFILFLSFPRFSVVLCAHEFSCTIGSFKSRMFRDFELVVGSNCDSTHLNDLVLKIPIVWPL